jgi:sialidase-1
VDDKGTVHLLFQKDYKEVWYTNSNDDGSTWTAPVNITPAVGQFSSTYNWNVVAPGPGHSIQLSNGRLLAPVWMVDTKKLLPRRAHSPSCVGTIYSDDYGKTWQRGTIVADSTGFIPNPNESMPVQLSDGSVLLSMRNASRIKQRAFSTSPDGISAWTPARYAAELYDPTCMASIVRLPNWKPKGKPALVFLNPDSRNIEKHPRANLTASISFDDGNTWQLHKVVNSGPSGYSDMAVGNDNTVYCLYETNTRQHKGFTYSLVLKKFNAQWLQQKSN